MRRQYVCLVSWTAEECEAIRIVTPSDNDDSNHHIPEDIEGWITRRRSYDDGSRGCQWERWDLAGHVDGCSMMIIRNMQVPCQTIWSAMGLIVVSTALTSESLFELSYRIPKLLTWICNWIESPSEYLMTSNSSHRLRFRADVACSSMGLNDICRFAKRFSYQMARINSIQSDNISH